MFMLGFAIFIVACNSDDEGVLPEPFVINECKTVGINTITARNENGKEVKALTIQVTSDQDTLLVEYLTEPGFYVNNLSYHLATDPRDIPRGTTAFRDYTFKEAGRKIVISVLTQEPDFSGLLYMAAFANIGTYPIDAGEEIECNVTRTNSLESQSYFSHSLTNFELNQVGLDPNTDEPIYDTITTTPIGEFAAFCLQGDQAMNTGARHLVRRLSSYSIDRPKLDGVVDDEKNMDLVNWVINQDRTRWMRSDDLPANGADVQSAIWDLVETTGSPTGQYIDGLFDQSTVDRIVEDAKRFGNGFKPGCFQNELIILHKGIIQGFSEVDSTFNTGRYAEPFNYQVSGIVKRIDCDNIQQVFSRGTQFAETDSIGAPQYFAVCVN